MRTTINIDDELLRRAAEATGVSQKTELVRLGLEALVQREAGRRLIELAGSDPTAKAPPRRKPWQDAEYERWKKSKRRAG